MDPKDKKQDDAAKAAKKKQEGQDDDTPPGDLEKENRELKAQVAKLQKRIQELEAEQKAAASQARAKKLIKRLEKQGVSFASEEERETEMKRLVGLSDDAFTATEAAYERMAKSQGTDNDQPSDKDKKEDGKQSAQASSKQNMQSSADLRPHDVDDQKQSLEEKLTNGFMAAYESRTADQ